MDTRVREHWTGPSLSLGEAWTLVKGRHTATCELFSHQLGWELRLAIGELLRTHVCRGTDEVLRMQEEWRAALSARGYEDISS